MTEEEWVASRSPVAMFRHLEAGPNDRKVLLYASALCRLRPELLTDVIREWIAAVERVLGGEADEGTLDKVQESAEFETSHLAEDGPGGTRTYYRAIADVVFVSWQFAETEDFDRPPPMEELRTVGKAHADIIRDIFGNPFRPISFAPAWRTDTAVSLAKHMYESRDFSAMPVLADALQDAGCDNDDILTHCRDEKQIHVRGCWVVDLILEKA